MYRENYLRARQKGICWCQLSASVLGCLLAICLLIAPCMPTGHFGGGETYVSARAELVSMLDASDMEQRLSKGLAHQSV